jgi:hypothetical protein
MSKKNSYTPTETTIDEAGMVHVEVIDMTPKEETKPEFIHTAFSIVNDDGVYRVLRIPFNYKTGHIGNVEEVESHPSRMAANNGFKVKVATSGLLG